MVVEKAKEETVKQMKYKARQRRACAVTFAAEKRKREKAFSSEQRRQAILFLEMDTAAQAVLAAQEAVANNPNIIDAVPTDLEPAT